MATVIIALSAAAANGTDELLKDFSAVIPDRFKPMLQDAESIRESISTHSLSELLISELAGEKSALASFFLFFVGICVISSVAAVYRHGRDSIGHFGIFTIATSVLLTKISALLLSVISSLKEANAFFSSLIPIFCAVNASGGGAGTASAQATGMSVTVSLVSAVASRLLPFVAVTVFFLEILNLLGLDTGIAKSIKGVYTKTLGAVTFILAIVLSFQTVIASASDGIAIRAAKYGVANMIPIVGSTVSSALSALSGGLAYVKSVVGVGAVAVIVYIFLSPLVLLLLYRMAIVVAVSLEGYFGMGEGSLGAPFLGIMDCIIASYSLCAALYVFEIILFIRYGIAL